MAIYIRTSNPELLLHRINHAIDNRDIITWSYDKDGDYTIDREQWKFRAWMRPVVEDGNLILVIVQSRKYPLTRELYGVYHGRFVSTILAHFSQMIEDIHITPRPEIGRDIFNTGA